MRSYDNYGSRNREAAVNRTTFSPSDLVAQKTIKLHKATLSLEWKNKSGVVVSRMEPSSSRVSSEQFLRDALAAQHDYDFLGLGWVCEKLQELIAKNVQLRQLAGRLPEGLVTRGEYQ